MIKLDGQIIWSGRVAHRRRGLSVCPMADAAVFFCPLGCKITDISQPSCKFIQVPTRIKSGTRLEFPNHHHFGWPRNNNRDGQQLLILRKVDQQWNSDQKVSWSFRQVASSGHADAADTPCLGAQRSWIVRAVRRDKTVYCDLDCALQ